MRGVLLDGLACGTWKIEVARERADLVIEPFGPLTEQDRAALAEEGERLLAFAERDHENIVSWSEFDRGGHWAAHDAPDLLVGDISQFFRGLR